MTQDNTPPRPIFKAQLFRTKHDSNTKRHVFRKLSTDEIFPTTPSWGPTPLLTWSNSDFENQSRGCVCYLLSPMHVLPAKTRVASPCSAGPRTWTRRPLYHKNPNPKKRTAQWINERSRGGGGARKNGTVLGKNRNSAGRCLAVTPTPVVPRLDILTLV